MSKSDIKFTKETSEYAIDIFKQIADLFEKLDDKVGLEELIYSLTEVANRKWRADEMLMMMVHGFSQILSVESQITEVMEKIEEAAAEKETEDEDEPDYTLN